MNLWKDNNIKLIISKFCQRYIQNIHQYLQGLQYYQLVVNVYIKTKTLRAWLDLIFIVHVWHYNYFNYINYYVHSMWSLFWSTTERTYPSTFDFIIVLHTNFKLNLYIHSPTDISSCVWRVYSHCLLSFASSKLFEVHAFKDDSFWLWYYFCIIAKRFFTGWNDQPLK